MELDTRTTRGWADSGESRSSVGWLHRFLGGIGFPTPIKQRKQKAHGWNKRRLIMWGGRYPPKC